MIWIGSVEFVWDEEKNRFNQQKHGVGFEEAATIFMNLPLEIVFDPDHSSGEERYIAIGASIRDRVLIVVHCENESGSRVRLISARKATRNEIRSFLKPNAPRRKQRK